MPQTNSRACIILTERVILPTVINMKESKELLSSILKTTQMGQVGIRSVLDSNMRPTLRKALESQLQEYDSIETEAHCIASSRGWQVPELDPMVRTMADMMTRMRLTGGNTDSKIAGMMIQGNTRGMILSLKNMRRCDRPDSQVAELAQKLLETEKNNIESLEGFV